MSNTSPQNNEDYISENTTLVLASTDDLAAIGLTTVLKDFSQCEDYAMAQSLFKLAKDAESTNNIHAQRSYHLFAVLCSLHLRVEDPAEPWSPKWQGANNRSYIASDFRGEQNEILEKIVNKIPHPALRARVADVVWYNNRKCRDAAVAAVEAYCDTIKQRLDGKFLSQFHEKEDSILDIINLFHRSLQINALSQKRGYIPQKIENVFEVMYERALTTNQYVAFVKIAELGTSYKLVEWSKVASDAERLAAQNIDQNCYPMALREVWNLAVKGYSKLNNTIAQRRCQGRSVEELLRMRDQVSTALAKAYWTRKAIGELRAARGFKERIDLLRVELRDLQDAALDEQGQFSVPMDLSKEQQGTIKVFSNLTLPDVLLEFALLSFSPKVSTLREQALENQKNSFFGSLFGSSYVDREGKTYAESSVTPRGIEPDSEWFKEQSLQYLDIMRHHIVGGAIEPARLNVMNRFPLEQRHFAPIADMSPFVPQGHEHLFSLGFTRFWQGDYASASYLLIPQLENSLRYVLLNANRETSKIKPDLLQEDRSLSGLLESLRPQLEEIFGVDLINEIDLLFNYKPGPALRHEMAHGKLSAGDCYYPTTVYACWLIYHITCLPLINSWKVHVSPLIEQAMI
ncbi:DUF4209 domain-containing protein [Yersinia enterocolitica]|uniref:DUF4209 domain-containing protein n=1 Tax=Yersinia enterocolitica TaxID=630 RepID=UPI0009F66455|nr:DUF4209 domain-containing protein [Yersinia enterocolitica]PNM18897.1 hypothetical protein A6J65_008430 [Yersinia enterocolitica]HDL7734722.1 DUF4209 domain-containing protein [Yersinia enterocolitica]HDL8479339.1 DUF4209 domain-containing protein [Yersinia enterocolitica]HDL8507660.1 DUF4209 domain-containing protein [Yersinia enterocolitica]